MKMEKEKFLLFSSVFLGFWHLVFDFFIIGILTMMSIVTRTGDKGDTGLFGAQRVSKSSSRMHAIGAVDELNAMFGALLAEHHLPEPLHTQITRIQHLLFSVGADLATPTLHFKKHITEHHISIIERWIDELEVSLPPLQTFILPGGSPAGATLHLARTVCRRAERWMVACKEEKEAINPQCLIFLNRLSDYLFLAARKVNRITETEETAVQYQ